MHISANNVQASSWPKHLQNASFGDINVNIINDPTDDSDYLEVRAEYDRGVSGSAIVETISGEQESRFEQEMAIGRAAFDLDDGLLSEAVEERFGDAYRINRECSFMFDDERPNDGHQHLTWIFSWRLFPSEARWEEGHVYEPLKKLVADHLTGIYR